MILTHGYTDNRIGSLKYVPLYMRLGFNCIIYDLRGHGENEKHITTYGILEGADLNCLIKDTRERYQDIAVLGLHGESLGSATTITCMKYKPEVDFAVADCGFADIVNVLHTASKFGSLTPAMIKMTDCGSKLRYGYTLADMRPIEALKENKVPILFIHGEDDELISPENSRSMSQITKGISVLHTVPGAGHAMSIFTDPEAYEGYVKDFLADISIT